MMNMSGKTTHTSDKLAHITEQMMDMLVMFVKRATELAV